MRRLARLARNEDGQVLILFALLMAVLMGFVALSIDLGVMYATKSNLQKAADAAALAGAADLPSSSAIDTAKNYAEANGVEKSNTNVKTLSDGDTPEIEVVCTKNVPFSFGKILGLSNKNVSAKAVAKYDSRWAGDVLPFVNLDDSYGPNDEIVAWEKTGPGDFESMWPDEYTIQNSNNKDKLYFKVDWTDGLEITKGTVATIKQEVGDIYESHLVNGVPTLPVYILSLSKTVMNSGKVLLTDGSYRSLSKLKNKDIIDPSQLVLVKCIFHDYDYSGKTLFLTALESYDINNGEYPSDYVSPDGGTPKLVQ